MATLKLLALTCGILGIVFTGIDKNFVAMVWATAFTVSILSWG